MVNLLAKVNWVIHRLVKMVNIIPIQVDLEPGTTMRFWVPSETVKKHGSSTGPKPNKPAVVLVHGFAADGIFTWQLQVLALARKYSVYVPDLLFFGNSTTESSDRTIGFQAHCVAAALQKLGVKSYTLVGFCYGGFVSFELVELYPDRVEALVVSGGFVSMTETLKRGILERSGSRTLSDLFLPQSVDGLEALRKNASRKLPSFRSRLTRDYLKLMFSNRKERGELLEAMVIKDADYAIPCFPRRIHLLWGEYDKIVKKESAQGLKEQLGDKATYQVIDKAGHLVHLERPWIYTSCLKQFLDSLPLKNQRLFSYQEYNGDVTPPLQPTFISSNL